MKRLPRKLKKEYKKTGFYQFCKVSIPIVRSVVDFPNRKSLTELLTIGSFHP